VLADIRINDEPGCPTVTEMRWGIAKSHATAAVQAQKSSVGRSVVSVNDTVEISRSLEFWGPPGGRLNFLTGSASVIGGIPPMDVTLAAAVPKCQEFVFLDSSWFTGPHCGGTRGGNETRSLLMAGVTIGTDSADTSVAYHKFAAGVLCISSPIRLANNKDSLRDLPEQNIVGAKITSVAGRPLRRQR